MTPYRWYQVNIAFPDWEQAEHIAAVHLAPVLDAATSDDLITAWFFMRKTPCWRVRYLPRSVDAQAHMRLHLDALQGAHRITTMTEVLYEPEQRVFGGAEGMECAHRLFHADSRYLLAHLAAERGVGHRRELSIMLCSVMMREAGLDWYEQGDVWARVADHRDLPDRIPPDRRHALEADLRRLMSAATTLRANRMRCTTEWFEAFATAGRDLAGLAAGGQLRRGLRAVLAHHVIFAWNRLGLPYTAQAALAHSAAAVVFGVDPAGDHLVDAEQPVRLVPTGKPDSDVGIGRST